MKKTFSLILLSLTFFAISCNSEKKPQQEDKSHFDDKSKFYKETIIVAGGDFLGFNLGCDLKDAISILPKEKIVLDKKEYQLYKNTASYSDTEYQLFFKDDKLEEINFDTYILDEKGNMDKNGALILFNELKAKFLKRYGNKYMESSDENNEILYWSKDKKSIQLINEFEKGSIHVYLDIAEFE